MVNFLTVRTQFTIYYVRRFFSDLTGDIYPCPPLATPLRQGGVLKIATAGNLKGKCLLTPPPGPQHMLFVVTVLIESQPILAYI